MGATFEAPYQSEKSIVDPEAGTGLSSPLMSASFIEAVVAVVPPASTWISSRVRGPLVGKAITAAP